MEETRANPRRTLVKELFSVGLSCPQIAHLSGWSVDKVQRDLEKLGGAEEFTARPRGRQAVWPAAFARYARLIAEPDCSEGDPVTNDLRHCLAQYIRVPDILQVLKGVELTMALLKEPVCHNSDQPFLELLTAVFYLPRRKRREMPQESASSLWHEYVLDVGRGKMPPPPSYEELLAMFVEQYAEKYRGAIAPIWEAGDASTAVRGAVATLTPREQEVIQKRFGLHGGRPQLLEEVARDWSVSRERIRQIEAKALRKLRHPSRKARLRILIDPVGSVVKERLDASALTARTYQAPRECAAGEGPESTSAGSPHTLRFTEETRVLVFTLVQTLDLNGAHRQLADERGYQLPRRAHPENRGRAAPVQKLRPQVAPGDQGYPRADGPLARDTP